MTDTEIDEALAKVATSYTERGLLTRLKILLSGISKPRGSKEYKEARIECQRLAAPVSAVLMPILAVVLLSILSSSSNVSDRIIETQLIEAEEAQPLEEIPDEIKDVEPEEMTDVMQVDLPSLGPSVDTTVQETTQTAVSPQPQAFDAVMTVRSPVILKNIFGSTRNTGTRGQALARFGGDKHTEEAVMRALRWLKTQQRPDGGWNGKAGNTASTGFAILAYLAHGEVPGSSEEFGTTIQRAIEFLMRQTYHDPVATHALAEAYGMTMNPNLKVIAEKSLNALVKQLCETKWGPGRDGDGTTRPDLLGMAFNVMSLRSAQLAKLKIDRIDQALKKLKEGFHVQSNPQQGGFCSDHYGAPGSNYRRSGTWHFMIGVVGMQYLGSGDDDVVKKTLALLDDIWPPPTLGTSDVACCPVRSNYWSTMVFFNEGGKRWTRWNRDMKEVYIKGQEIESGKYKDQNGKPHEIGYWHCEDQHIGLQPVMPTCYIVQQLMVYYRYLPTSSKEAWNGEPELRASATDVDDIQVETGNL